MYLNLPPYLEGEQFSCGPNLRNLGAGLNFQSSVLLWKTPLDSRLQSGHLGNLKMENVEFIEET